MSSPEIDNFCALAQQQKGLALVFLIEKVLSNPKLFVFGELLSVPSVTALKDVDAGNSDSAAFLKSYNSLELFAYGTFQDYMKNPDDYIVLNPASISKLKQLSIISCAETNKVISYALLQKELNIDSVRALEDLIIETMYSGLITGKLNQEDSILRVQSFIGRDVRKSEIAGLIAQLEQFKQACAEQIVEAESSTAIIQKQREVDAKRQQSIEKAITKNKAAIRDSSKKISGYDAMDSMQTASAIFNTGVSMAMGGAGHN
mgnify:FL=1